MIRTLALATPLAILLAVVSSASFAQETPKGDPAKGQAASAICAACHGADGNTIASMFPNLAGQKQAYILKQLTNFKAGARQDPSMDAMIAGVEKEDLPHLAAWFSQQKSAGTPTITATDEQIAHGKRLWRAGDAARGIPACAACHGANGAGLEAQYPRLSGQYPEYTEKQLLAFRNGERTNDSESMMRDIAGRLSDKDISAVSNYAAGLR